MITNYVGFSVVTDSNRKLLCMISYVTLIFRFYLKLQTCFFSPQVIVFVLIKKNAYRHLFQDCNLTGSVLSMALF